MLEKLNLAVLFGGVSSEHDVSCMSARTFADGLDVVHPESLRRTLREKIARMQKKYDRELSDS